MLSFTGIKSSYSARSIKGRCPQDECLPRSAVETEVQAGEQNWCEQLGRKERTGCNAQCYSALMGWDEWSSPSLSYVMSPCLVTDPHE